MAKTPIKTNIVELLWAVERWCERKLGLQLRKHTPGDTLVIFEDQHYRQLSVSVGAKGEPLLTGKLAELIDVAAAIEQERTRAAAEDADLKKANIKELEDAAKVAANENSPEAT